jgi:uncharacterized protein YjbI with pentapeptide repeats
MANPEHVAILKQGVDAWNQWRRENPATKPNLEGIILKRHHLRSIDLSEATISKAILDGTILSNANLRSTVFTRSRLKRVKLDHVQAEKAVFERADLYEADLSNANCHGSVMRRVDLQKAILRGVDLSGANLERVSFDYADLTQASFREANLESAELVFADCSNANFQYGNLIGADFTSANLYSANLGNTQLARAIFCNTALKNTDVSNSTWGLTIVVGVELNDVKGIETTEHLDRSLIGMDILELSARGITASATNQISIEIFLRKAGIAEETIRHFRTMIVNPIKFYSCFISYTHADKAFARRLHDQLQARGIRCWLDEHQLLPVYPIMQFVDRGIRLYDKVLLCCTESSLNSWWVKDEIKKAMQKERQLEQQRGKEVYSLIPLNLDGYLFSDEYESEFESVLKERLAADFTGWERDNAKFEEQFERVVKALRTEREEPPEAKL